MKQVTVKFNDNDTLEIEGQLFSGDFFRAMGSSGIPIGAIVEVVNRDNEGISVKRHFALEEFRDNES